MRRLIPVVLGVAIVLGGVFGLAVIFNSRDEADLAAPAGAEGPGTLEPDAGREHVDVATKELRLSARPPTSGPHQATNVTAEGAIDDRTLLHALELGNVVLVYEGDRAPAALRTIQAEVSGPFDPELAAAGQMVILVSRPEAAGVQGLAWRRRLVAKDPADPALRDFAEAWLGRGAP